MTGFFSYSQSKSGLPVPLYNGKPLHSMFDPEKEAGRLMEQSGDNGFIILLGLGAVYHSRAALRRANCRSLLVIEYNSACLDDLLRNYDYSGVLEDERFNLLLDPDPDEIIRFFINHYIPAVHGGFSVFPLRTRTSIDSEKFSAAAMAIEKASAKISADYSVQSYFGLKWFSNIIRNLKLAEKRPRKMPVITTAAVCAAGPSLDDQIPLIKKRRDDLFLIAADTAFPALMNREIVPDAVISIDCQHISYQHFRFPVPDNVLLFMDIASPPLIASRTASPCFFYSSHPFCHYLDYSNLKLPFLDTSGGNVTYAGVSLAAALGAGTIELYGADFSYPQGRTYAGGTYIHDLFSVGQQRLKTLESQYSSFLFRTALAKKTSGKDPGNWYYETDTLNFYRNYLETENPAGNCRIVFAEGKGAPITPKQSIKKNSPLISDTAFNDEFNSREFLNSFINKLNDLPLEEMTEKYHKIEKTEERLLFSCLLPTAAALRRKNNELNPSAEKLLILARDHCTGKARSVLKTV